LLSDRSGGSRWSPPVTIAPHLIVAVSCSSPSFSAALDESADGIIGRAG